MLFVSGMSIIFQLFVDKAEFTQIMEHTGESRVPREVGDTEIK